MIAAATLFVCSAPTPESKKIPLSWFGAVW